MLNKLRLLTPGPTPLPERVRLALARDMIHHRKTDFMAMMARVQKRLGVLFGTKGPVLPLSCSGTGAMTAAVYSLFRPGDRVLVVEGGKFGERWTEIARMRGLEPVVVSVPWGCAVEPAAVAEKLEEDPGIRGVLIQLSETSTGVLHPVAEVAAVTRARDVLLVADGISAVGISPCPMDEWAVDCLLTGSQKGLMLPPGLALIALSDRAWERAEADKPGCFYFDLPAERRKLAGNQTHFTSPVNLIAGLDESLDMMLEEGLDAIYKKQWALTMMTRAGAAAMGFEMLAPDHFAWGITSIALPFGVDGQKVLANAQEKYGVCMAGGQDRLKGRIVRIGHMGWVDWADVLAGLHALARSVIDCGGFTASRDYLEIAMSAYRAALDAPAGETVPAALIRS